MVGDLSTVEVEIGQQPVEVLDTQDPGVVVVGIRSEFPVGKAVEDQAEGRFGGRAT